MLRRRPGDRGDAQYDARWLTLTAQLSLVKLIPAAILAYRMRDDGLIFVFYYADRMTFLLGFCGMLTITNYTSVEQAVGRVGSARRGARGGAP